MIQGYVEGVWVNCFFMLLRIVVWVGFFVLVIGSGGQIVGKDWSLYYQKDFYYVFLIQLFQISCIWLDLCFYFFDFGQQVFGEDMVMEINMYVFVFRNFFDLGKCLVLFCFQGFLGWRGIYSVSFFFGVFWRRYYMIFDFCK